MLIYVFLSFFFDIFTWTKQEENCIGINSNAVSKGMLNIAICLCKDPYCGMKPVLLISALISVLSVKFATSQSSQKWVTLPESTENWTIVNDIDLLKTEGILVAADRPKNSADECDKVMNQPTDKRCKFIQSTPDCAAEDGFINYPWITFCMLPPQLLPVAIFLYVVWLLVLFLILGLIASEFFCPNLSAISSSLRLTHNVAGVTFLALGNGAPDVFSAMAAFSRPQTGGLAIGALFGAGIYVTTVVAGSIALVKPFRVASRPFLRDIIFYIAAVFWTFTILYKRHIDLKEALGYLGLYVLYVIVVIVSTHIYRHQNRSQPEPLQNYNITHDIQTEDSYSENLNGNTDVHEVEYEPLIPFTETTSNIFLKGINPVDSRTWRRSNWGWKAIKIIQFPFQVVLLLTVPVVDTDKEDRNWIRPLNSLHFITGPLVCVLTFNSGIYGLYLIEGEFPVWLLIGLIGVFLAGIVLCTTTNEHPPPYHSLFSLLGFVVSALWINTVASEVVSVLHLLGVTLSLSNTVLGLTLLAWGNSIGDTFADITLARQGYPRMAISACFGGIIFNMLFGIGLGCLLQMFHNGIIMLEPEGLLCWILAGALGLSLVLSFVLVPLQGFHLSRAYSIFLLFFYFVFLIVALLTEFGKIHI